MDVVTVDCLNLKETEFFSVCNKFGNESEIVNPRNILDYGDDALFSWDHEEHCLVVLLTRTLMVDGSKTVQKLRPTEMILAEVVELRLNNHRTRIAVVCAKDVYVIDLPPRSGWNGVFKGGASDVTCSCRRLYIQSGLTNILQVHWHPDVEQDYYLAVLTSDNIIQLNDVRAGPRSGSVDTWILNTGPHNRIPSLDSIGEVAVDFHFIPQSTLKHISPVYSSTKTNEPMDWPALILRGNGDIVIIDLAVKNEGRKYGKTTSPLLMYPSAEDNYGVDCCGILILDGPLPIVVIASSTGILYHGILLNHPASDYQNYDVKKSDSIHCDNSSDAVYVLHVIESVELDIGLNLGSSIDETLDEIASSPIKLVHDHISNTRYFALHAAGVHSISLPVIYELGIFFSKNYKSVDLPPQALLDFKKNKCVVEYAVCSQINGSKPSLILGAVCFECPTPILVVLFPDTVISVQITSWFISPNDLTGKTVFKELPLDETKSPSFQENVHDILRPDNKSIPIFKMGDPTNPTPQQCLELLARATSYFRETIIPRHEQAAQLIRTKVRMLLKMKERQRDDLKQLVQMKSELQDKAGSLAEKYEDINEKQIELTRRAEQVLLIVKTRERGLTKSEKMMLDNLAVVQNLVDRLKAEIDAIQLKEATQHQVISSQTKEKLHELYLSDTHFQIITNNFANMSADINNLVTQINDAEAELDLNI